MRHPSMRLAPRELLLGLTTLVLVAPSPARGQVVTPRIGLSSGYERYGFQETEGSLLESVSLLSTPFAATAAVGSMRLDLAGAWARGEARWRDGSTMSLAGLTDTELRISTALADGGLRLELIGHLPTGASTHDADEAAVARIVAADLLPFRVSNWGTAGAVALNVSGARRFGRLGLGAAASYRLSGEFDPIQGETFAYQPGNEVRLRLAMDYSVGRSQQLSLALGYRNYSADAANGENLFQTGDRMTGLATWSFAVSRRSAGALYGGLTHRQSSAFLDLTEGSSSVPSQNLVLLGGMLRLPFGGGYLSPRVDGRVFRQGEGVGDGYVLGGGVSLELPAATRATFVPSAGVRLGSVAASPGVDVSFVGLDVGLIIRIRPGSGGR